MLRAIEVKIVEHQRGVSVCAVYQGLDPFFTSNRATTDQPLDRVLSFALALERIRAPRNGLRDVYRGETERLDLGSPCGSR